MVKILAQILFYDLDHRFFHFGCRTEELALGYLDTATDFHQGKHFPELCLRTQLDRAFVMSSFPVLLPSKRSCCIVILMPEVSLHLSGHFDFATLIMDAAGCEE